MYICNEIENKSTTTGTGAESTLCCFGGTAGGPLLT